MTSIPITTLISSAIVNQVPREGGRTLTPAEQRREVTDLLDRTLAPAGQRQDSVGPLNRTPTTDPELLRSRERLIILTRDPSIPTTREGMLRINMDLVLRNSLSQTNVDMVNAALSLNLRLNPNGNTTFTRDSSPGSTFTLQPQDGSILVTSPNNGNQTGTYIRNNNGQYTLDRNTTRPLIGTEALTNLRALRNIGGTYSVYRSNNELYLQRDGSVYDRTNRRTYRNENGRWQWVENTNAIPSTFEIARLDLTPTQNGHWALPGDPRAYFIREDGTIYTPGGGSTSRLQPARRYNTTTNTWEEDRRSLQGSAYMIARYNLTPQQDGTYRNPNEPGTMYVPQDDGSMFLSEAVYSSINGQNVGRQSLGPVTFHSDRWDLRRNRPISGTGYIQAFGLTNNNGTLTSPMFNGNFYRISRDRLYYINPSNNRHVVFSNGTWARASVEDYIETFNLTPTGNADGSLRKPGDNGRYYRLPNNRLLYIGANNEQWVFGHYGGERGDRTVWNRPEGNVAIPNPPIAAPR